MMPTVKLLRLLQGSTTCMRGCSHLQSSCACSVTLPHHMDLAGGTLSCSTHLSLKPLCRPSESSAVSAVLLLVDMVTS